MSSPQTSTALTAAELLAAPARQVDAYLEQYLKSVDLPRNLVDAMSYSLLGEGKRLRPVLVIRSCEAVGGKAEAAMPAAAAIEMIHCFSLIHDDLPAMDDDDLRRGRPTLHKATNEAMAILAGDAMMGLAFELLVDRLHPPELATRIVRELARGTNAMIAGQVYDTLPDFDESVEPLEKLRTIHRHKTGALIRASARMGAICAGAKAEQVEALSRYADAIGLMFQVVDDLLDVTQTTEQLGKTAGKDANQEKTTYPGVLGIEATRDEVSRLQQEATESLKPLGEAAIPLRQLCDYLAVRTK
ncbi:MAG: polyprenyl synthetase family protein [Phycisphaeraceae bacterium]